MIAEDGLDYSSAKRKAAKQIVGATRLSGEWLPDNDHLEDEIREYQAIFQGETQPLVLQALRRIALDWMKRLAQFNPYLTGAVLNGTAGVHSDIHLQLFCDSTKDVSIFLLNAGVDYAVTEARHFAGRAPVEMLNFLAPQRDAESVALGLAQVGVCLALYALDDLRGALRTDGRGLPVRATAVYLASLLNPPAPTAPAPAAS